MKWLLSWDWGSVIEGQSGGAKYCNIFATAPPRDDEVPQRWRDVKTTKTAAFPTNNNKMLGEKTFNEKADQLKWSACLDMNENWEKCAKNVQFYCCKENV